jgi:hypothetical protein
MCGYWRQRGALAANAQAPGAQAPGTQPSPSAQPPPAAPVVPQQDQDSDQRGYYPHPGGMMGMMSGHSPGTMGAGMMGSGCRVSRLASQWRYRCPGDDAHNL